MTALDPDLLALEKGFWTGDEAFFRENADETCLVAFAEMRGLMGNADLAATAGDGNRWKKIEMEQKGFVEPTANVTILTYEARAVRANGEPYAALVSSGYVMRADGWKLMFHSHTPLPAK